MAAPDSFERLTLGGRVPPARAGWGAGRRPILISRALYRLRVFDLTGVRARDRQEAISLQLTAWAPFDTATYAVGLAGRQAVAFAWDSALIDTLLEGASRRAERPLWPEDLVRPPLQDGVRLHACLDGFEAQAWRDGVPVESLWWPEFPDEAQWSSFLHGRVASALSAASMGSGVAPRDAGTPWRTRPWLRVMPVHALNRHGSTWERLLWGGLAATLAVAAGWRSQEWHQVAAAREAAAAERERLQAESATGLAQREQVLRDQVRVEKIGQALDGVPVFELLNRLGQALPQKGVLLRVLRVEGSAVRASLAMGADMPRSTVVQSLQAAGYFSDVREQREPGPGGSVTFEMTYRRQGVEAGGAAATSGAAVPSSAPSGATPPPPAAAKGGRS
jgi:hypothetical protein